MKLNGRCRSARGAEEKSLSKIRAVSGLGREAGPFKKLIIFGYETGACGQRDIGEYLELHSSTVGVNRFRT
jgi:hypothetical protein